MHVPGGLGRHGSQQNGQRARGSLVKADRHERTNLLGVVPEGTGSTFAVHQPHLPICQRHNDKLVGWTSVPRYHLSFSRRRPADAVWAAAGHAMFPWFAYSTPDSGGLDEPLRGVSLSVRQATVPGGEDMYMRLGHRPLCLPPLEGVFWDSHQEGGVLLVGQRRDIAPDHARTGS